MIQKVGQCFLTQFTAWIQRQWYFNKGITMELLPSQALLGSPYGKVVGLTWLTITQLRSVLSWDTWCRCPTGSIWCKTDPARRTLSEDIAGECFVLTVVLVEGPGIGIAHSLLKRRKIQLLRIEVVWVGVDFQTLPYASDPFHFQKKLQ